MILTPASPPPSASPKASTSPSTTSSSKAPHVAVLTDADSNLAARLAEPAELGALDAPTAPGTVARRHDEDLGDARLEAQGDGRR